MSTYSKVPHEGGYGPGKCMAKTKQGTNCSCRRTRATLPESGYTLFCKPHLAKEALLFLQNIGKQKICAVIVPKSKKNYNDYSLISNSIFPKSSSRVEWYVSGADGDIIPYDSETCDLLSNATMGFLQSTLILFINNYYYEIDIKQMTQRNLLTNKIRKIGTTQKTAISTLACGGSSLIPLWGTTLRRRISTTFLEISSPRKLSRGVDQFDMTPKNYSRFVLSRIWRNGNPMLKHIYNTRRRQMQQLFTDKKIPPVDLNSLIHVLPQLPQEPGLNRTIGETYLFHGTSPDRIVSILQNGLDPQRCGETGVSFGYGNYFADEFTKSDQYGAHDEGMFQKGEFISDSAPLRTPRKYAKESMWPLHNMIKDSTYKRSERVMYMLVFRVIIGASIETRDNIKSIQGGKLRHVRNRQLAVNPATDVPYNTLIGQPCNHAINASGVCPNGCRQLRREIIQTDPTLSYPEYLIEYERKTVDITKYTPQGTPIEILYRGKWYSGLFAGYDSGRDVYATFTCDDKRETTSAHVYDVRLPRELMSVVTANKLKGTKEYSNYIDIFNRKPKNNPKNNLGSGVAAPASK